MTGDTTSTDPAQIDADDLAMLATGFESAMLAAPGSGAADAALFHLGWAELLSTAPMLGAATAFAALGRTGSAAALLDDVLAVAFTLEPTLSTCVVLPRPHHADPPGRRHGGAVVVDGLVSGRVDTAETAIVAIGAPKGVEFVTVDADHVRSAATSGLDPGAAYRRVRVELGPDSQTRSRGVESGMNEVDAWGRGVAAARVALAHQLISSARWMLEAARTHAIDRSQFGRPVASFQAVRHKLAEALVAIEGAQSVAHACTDDVDPLLAAVAKSLAGKAARTAATHAQQVLGGIGFTTDHEFHRWLKRVLVVDTVFGSATSLPTEIGRQLLAAGGAPRLIEL